MTARVVLESYDGSTVAVDVMKVMGRSYVSVNTHEFDTDVDAVEVDRDTLVYLTPAETAELVEALNAKLVELAIQTAPVGAGAAPTGETSDRDPLADDPDGNTRTTAAGPSTAEPGRPAHDSAAYRAETAAMLARNQAKLTAGIDADHEAALVEDTERATKATASVPCPTCTAPLRTTTGLVCQVCGTDYGDENHRAVAAVLNSARAELLANSTPVPATTEAAPCPTCRAIVAAAAELADPPGHVHAEWTECNHQDECCSACHVDEDDEEEDTECEGHEPEPGRDSEFGVTVYCDGSCRPAVTA